jgi:DNA (cytosine-5)-methyltransferase 1
VAVCPRVLFAGLGGFHVAMERLGHTGVFACEINGKLRRVYKTNFGIEPAGNIRHVKLGNIPKHDVLCAGFPCQPKAGDQQGLNCPKWGDLFDYVLKIIRTTIITAGQRGAATVFPRV